MGKKRVGALEKVDADLFVLLPPSTTVCLLTITAHLSNTKSAVTQSKLIVLCVARMLTIIEVLQ